MHPGNCLSRRALLRGLTSSAAVIALGGCASLALTGDRFDAAEIKVNPTLLVATTRKPVNGARSKPWFGTERASRMTAARAALTPPERREVLARLGWARRLAPRCDRDGSAGRGSVRANDRRARCAGLCARLQPDVRDGGPRRGATRRRYPVPRRDHGVLLAVEGEAIRLRLRSRERDVVARRSRAGAGATRAQSQRRPRSHRRAQHRHHAGDGVVAPAVRPARLRRRSADRRRGVRSAGHRHGRLLLVVRTHRPACSRITVIAATNDRALAISGWIAGGITRVGTAEKARLEQLGLRVIDASQQGWGIVNHDLFLSNAQIRQVIRHNVEGWDRSPS